jgi:alpha-galactosidase
MLFKTVVMLRINMPNTAKIVFIGAGSMCFGLTMFRDIFFAEKLQGSTLTLVDINP